MNCPNCHLNKALDSNGAVVFRNLVKGRFVHFSADNVDINEYTLDGKRTFQATQVVAWQRGPPEGDLLEGINISKIATLCILHRPLNIVHQH